MTDNKNRCVITGIGVVSSIGKNVEECWNSILAGRTGIDHTHTMDTKDCYADYSAEIKDAVDCEKYDRATVFCLSAVAEALSDSGKTDFGGDTRVSVIMGSCVGGGRSIEDYYKGKKDRDTVLKMPISAIANHVAELCHAGGVVTNVANACAAGTISIAYASDLIRAGKADVVVAGGADAFSSVPYSGFLSLHALDENSCSPFNRSHGITLGEGAGAVIVESYEHAMARGAKIYCEVLGAGISSDAYHITAPRPDGEGQMSAIRSAMAHSGIPESDIDYVNAHGTGTAKNDEAEFLSLHTLFDGKKDDLCVSSTKAMTGHCLGAAGAIEAVFAIKALVENTVPPTLGFKEEDMPLLAEKAGTFDFVPNVAKRKELTTVMDNSFAFGGNNASILFSKRSGNIASIEEKPEIYITGVGLVTPLGNGKEAYLAACRENNSCVGKGEFSTIGADDYAAEGLKMAFYRKLDHFSQLQAVSGMNALRDGGYTVTAENAGDIGMIIGTADGALGPSCEFQEMITEKGNAAGSAFRFPNTVYNAAGGYLSICSGVKGYNVTVTNGTQSGLQSVAYAVNVLRNGLENAMLATGSDENSPVISQLYQVMGDAKEGEVLPYQGKEGYSLSDGSVSILLETAKGVKARGGKTYCKVVGYGMAHYAVPYGTVKGSQKGLEDAMKNALADAKLGVGDIDGVVGFANGSAEVDNIEISALNAVFNKKFPVITVKERMGEGRAATAALSLAQAAFLLHGDLKEEQDAYVAGKKVGVKGGDLNRIMVISYSVGGSYTAVIVERVKGEDR